jgi:hypothetical protein
MATIYRKVAFLSSAAWFQSQPPGSF